MNVFDKTPLLRAAVWLGGPPGKTFEKIRKRLRQDGIDVREKMDSARKPPTWAELVLINRDMVSHADNDKQKDLCRAAGVPFVIASLSYIQTRGKLVSQGFVDPAVSVKLAEPEEAEPEDSAPSQDLIEIMAQPAPQQENTVTSSVDPQAALETQKEQLRLFLLNLPPELRAVAIGTNTELRRVEEDEAFDRLFGPDFEAALTQLSDDALIRGLRRRFKTETLNRLSGAVALSL